MDGRSRPTPSRARPRPRRRLPVQAASRVTLNDAKLANYVKDLADPTCPSHASPGTYPTAFEARNSSRCSGQAAPSLPPSLQLLRPRPPLPQPQPQQQRGEASRSRAPSGSSAHSALRNSRRYETSRPPPSCPRSPRTSARGWPSRWQSSTSHTPQKLPPPPQPHRPRPPSIHSCAQNARLGGCFGSPLALRRSRPLCPHPLQPACRLVPLPAPSKEVCTVLQNHIDQERWIAKWSYSLSLARHLHAQHLLDRSILVRWIVDAFAASNLVQLPLLVELVQEVIVLILRRRCFARPFLAALLAQITALDARFDRAAAAPLCVTSSSFSFASSANRARTRSRARVCGVNMLPRSFAFSTNSRAKRSSIPRPTSRPTSPTLSSSTSAQGRSASVAIIQRHSHRHAARLAVRFPIATTSSRHTRSRFVRHEDHRSRLSATPAAGKAAASSIETMLHGHQDRDHPHLGLHRASAWRRAPVPCRHLDRKDPLRRRLGRSSEETDKISLPPSTSSIRSKRRARSTWSPC